MVVPRGSVDRRFRDHLRDFSRTLWVPWLSSAGIFANMESIAKAGRSVGSGVYRVAGAFARGARRVLSYVPLLGVAAAPPEVEETSESSAVRHGVLLPRSTSQYN